MPANPSCKLFGVGGAIITTGHIITNPLKAEATQLANNRAALATRSVVQFFFVVVVVCVEKCKSPTNQRQIADRSMNTSI